jgi:hypothetical protein
MPGKGHGNRRYDKRLWPTARPPYKRQHVIITSLHRTRPSSVATAVTAVLLSTTHTNASPTISQHTESTNKM